MSVAAPEVIKADIRDDPIDPRVESAFETKAVQIAINLKEGLLVNIARVFSAAQHIQREPQHLAVVALHEHLESGTIARLRALDQRSVIGCGKRRRVGRSKRSNRRRSVTW